MTTNNDHIQTLKQMRTLCIEAEEGTRAAYREDMKDDLKVIVKGRAAKFNAEANALTFAIDQLESSPWRSIETDGLPGNAGLYDVTVETTYKRDFGEPSWSERSVRHGVYLDPEFPPKLNDPRSKAIAWKHQDKPFDPEYLPKENEQ